MIKYILTSGGLGDAYICFLKIIKYTKLHHIHWTHVNSHKCHIKPINEIQNWCPRLVDARSLKIKGKKDIKHAEQEFKKTYPPGVRINSIATEMHEPFVSEITHPFLFHRLNVHKPHIIIQGRAGRNDNSSREFTIGFIKTIRDKWPKHQIILTGMKQKETNEDQLFKLNISDLRGVISLRHCFNLIARADHFYGHDGIQAYMAQSLKINSTIVYHLPNLFSHYLHSKWIRNTEVMVAKKQDYNSPTVITCMSQIERLSKLAHQSN